ncbi:helix-turn-helix domain-containing protein [Actinomadura graeca]|uniref:Helix-turn-helix domain-containing protein n=1 Tax=Actinomadura graeca TaxID=2750812 RepID=A0ABX8QRI8_9ACTN|nr:helix-turn-helix domain-containing protein [Actinomadura graeca]QXJ21285.1 helix-turn-helix domain-containing protein [Actinomadura graeca]
MTDRPRASLGRILEDLGATLLDLVCGDPDGADAIGGVVIHDPLDQPQLPRQALVLGVGVTGEEVPRLLTELGARGAAALVIRAPAPCREDVAEAAGRAGVCLLTLTRGASWSQLAAMLRSILAEGDIGEAGPQTLGGMPSGDLFALANAVAALLDAPVTIEDRSSRVLAFSGRQDEADASRVETILGRQVPERFVRMLEDRGVFRALYRSDEPVHVDPPETGWETFKLPRAAVAVRAGDEVLGSIWAAVPGPLSRERNRALREAAKLVALHMLRLRAGADVERRLRADLVGTALEGGPGAPEALGRLRLTGQATVVLALAPFDVQSAASAGLQARHTAERQRLADAFAMHLSAVHPRAAAAMIGDVVYGVLPVHADGRAEERVTRVASDFLERVGERLRPLVGIGPTAADGAALPWSRDGADRVLRVLRGHGGTRRVACLSDVHVEAMLLELGDLAAERGHLPAGPLARLAAYDAEHATSLVETLRAWLDAFGDVTAASAAMYVHHNTFRYRLRRLAEIGGIDLTDPDARFAAMLQLRLLPHGDPPR